MHQNRQSRHDRVARRTSTIFCVVIASSRLDFNVFYYTLGVSRGREMLIILSTVFQGREPCRRSPQLDTLESQDG